MAACGGAPCIASGQCSNASTCTISGLNNTGATVFGAQLSCFLQDCSGVTVSTTSPSNVFVCLPNLPATGVGAVINGMLCYKLSPSVGASQSVTITGCTAACTVWFESLSGTVALDGSAVGSASTGSSNSRQAGSITASGPGEVVITGLGAYCTAACTYLAVTPNIGLDSGFTIVQQNGSNAVAGGGIGFKVVTGSANPAWITDPGTSSQFDGGSVAYNLAFTAPASSTTGPRHKVTSE